MAVSVTIRRLDDGVCEVLIATFTRHVAFRRGSRSCSYDTGLVHALILFNPPGFKSPTS